MNKLNTPYDIIHFFLTFVASKIALIFQLTFLFELVLIEHVSET